MRYKDLIDDPSFPHWGRDIILDTLREGRDPVDTANVLEVLADAAVAELAVISAAAEVALASVAVAPRDDHGEVPGLMF